MAFVVNLYSHFFQLELFLYTNVFIISVNFVFNTFLCDEQHFQPYVYFEIAVLLFNNDETTLNFWPISESQHFVWLYFQF